MNLNMFDEPRVDVDLQTIHLYPFQSESVEALRENMRRGVLRQVLCSPTGSGKTEIAMAIVKEAQAKGSNVVFIADRQTLVTQTSERFANAGIRHGVAMGDQTYGRSEPIQICSAQTLEKRGFFFSGSVKTIDETITEFHERQIHLAIVDECHEVRKKIIEELKSRHIRTIGLSATPFTKGLGKHYSDVVNVTTTNELVKSKYLSPLKVAIAQSEVNVDGLKVQNTGEWFREELSERVAVVTGDIVPEWISRTLEFFGGPVKTIAFCASVADSEILAEKFQEAGHDFRVVHYKQSSAEKQEIINRFRNGQHIGLISCVALTKGFDVPETLCMIDAYPLRKAFHMHVQKLGRVMRIAPGKEFGLVIDHSAATTSASTRS